MRKLVLFAVPFGIAALLCAYLLSAFFALIFGGAALLCCLVLCFMKFEKKKAAAILAAGLAAGFLWSAGYEFLHLQPAWELDGQTMPIAATVCECPAQTDYGWRVQTEFQVNDRRIKTLLYVEDEIFDVAPGDTVHLSARLRKTDPSRENGDYYSLSSGYVLTASGKDARVTKCDATPIRFYPAVFSAKLRTALSEAVPADAAPFLRALITGDRSGLPLQTRDEISDAGFSHVIAVSGMHVSILVGVIYFLTRKHAALSAALGIPIILFFVFMTGASASVVRAGVMQTLMLIAPLLRRDTDGPTSLCAAMLVILLANPYAIAGISFQLSFAAVAGIFLCSQRIYHSLSRPAWLKRLLKKKLTRPPVFFLLSCTATTLGALLFTLPLSALHFGTVSLYSLLSNLLVLSVISLCFSLGLATGMLSMIFLPVAKPLGWLIAWPVRYVLWVAGWVSKLPFASVSVGTFYIAAWLLFSYLFILLAVLQKDKKPAFLTAACIFVSLAVSLLYMRLDTVHTDFSVTVLDVGQGQCVCMRAGSFTAIADCGGSNGYEAARTAEEYLTTAGIGEVDCLLVTHYDADHVNGVEKLLTDVSIEILYLPDMPDESGTRAGIEAAARKNGTEITYVLCDTTLPLVGGNLQIFAPVSHYDDNAACLSVLFSVAEYDMLLTGDMDFFSEYDLMLSHELPDVELFIAGHHGSATSSSADLLAQIRPETVIISVGAENRYGHPTQEALERFAAIGAEVYRTDECGNITVGR